MTYTRSSEPSNPAYRSVDDWDASRLNALADEYQTPLYVLDLERVRQNYQRLQSAFPAATIKYAAKANTGRAVLQQCIDLGIGIECGAVGELERALAAGTDGNNILYTAVNPPEGDLERVVDIASEYPEFVITAGAEMTLDRLDSLGYDGRLSIRVFPGVGAGHHEKVELGKDEKFGFPYDRCEAVIEDAASRFDVAGIHAHAGSGLLDEDIDSHTAVVERMAALEQAVDPDLDFVDIGGGFGVPYGPDDSPLTLAAIAEATRDAYADAEATLVLEPGRYLVADAGVLLTRVNTVKDAVKTTVVGVDASLATLVRPAMFDAHHPLRVLGEPDAPVEPLTVAGPICSSADAFCRGRDLPRPRPDDVLVVGNAGAYGIELASAFHSQPRPAEVVIDGDHEAISRERETLADVMRRERSINWLSDS